MLVMFNEKQNLIGLWEDGWNFVLVARPVFVHRPGIKLAQGLVSELHDYDSNWVPIGAL